MKATHTGSFRNENGTLTGEPEVVFYISLGDGARDLRFALVDDAYVWIGGTHISPKCFPELKRVADESNGDWCGRWGDIKKVLGRHTRYPHEDFGVMPIYEYWNCEPLKIKESIDILRKKISRRNRQIDDLRRELSRAQEDKKYWKGVAEDYKRTVSKS